jgi:hypothetical protein
MNIKIVAAGIVVYLVRSRIIHEWQFEQLL